MIFTPMLESKKAEVSVDTYGKRAPMDLHKTIGELRARKEQLERIIAQLEDLQSSGGQTSALAGTPRRRGRKSMGAKERAEVSKRMKNYWARRRKERAAD